MVISVIIIILAILFILAPSKEEKINETNSNLGVQCNAKEVCSLRHTTTCDTCKHNCGMKQDKNCYEKR